MSKLFIINYINSIGLETKLILFISNLTTLKYSYTITIILYIYILNKQCFILLPQQNIILQLS